MNPIRMAAVATVTLALILYTVGALAEQRSRRAGGAARRFLTLGLTFDVIATALMVAATGSFSPTLHGWLGYSALTLMLVDVVLIWRHWRSRASAAIPWGLHLYTRIAYAYWVIAYFTGAALVMAGRRHSG